MQGNLKQVIQSVSLDKNLDQAIIIDALEEAMVHAARRQLGVDVDLEAHFNEEADEIELFQFKTVVDEIENEDIEILPDEAKKHDPESVLGDALGFKIDATQFGRISAQTAKQIIVQKVRDAERAQIYEEYKDKAGEIISGYVRRLERGDIIVDLGRTEAVIPYRQQVPGEKYKAKDRIQGYVMEIRRASRGPQIVISRGHPGFLISLFEQHVSEIYDGIVQIVSAARDPGSRAKIAVFSKDSSVDPVGACVGMKGQRVQAIVQELNGEKIDIIPHDEDPARLVCNALAPASVSKVIVDEENHSMEVVVADDQLSLAIGKRGQNVRLAAQLSGWRLDIKSESKLDEASAGVRERIAQVPGIGPMRAEILVNDGIKSIEELAEVNPRVIARILNLETDEAENIKLAVNSFINGQFANLSETEQKELLSNAAATPEEVKPEEPVVSERDKKVEFFKQLKGVGEAAAFALADAGYVTIGDVLADSTEEVASKTELPVAIARTVQIAADSFLKEKAASRDKR